MDAKAREEASEGGGSIKHGIKLDDFTPAAKQLATPPGDQSGWMAWGTKHPGALSRWTVRCSCEAKSLRVTGKPSRLHADMAAEEFK
ncbi:hypothetical protein EYF80_028261 [Liparis tanakae]|uniref:Uncharacterized protein n=1 Tax=Liparis tanakae TaxID=230148 RepID=A0A4Z2H6Y6_9TELE|nr:hypothetical protein EYF80_028261 [Liparis tanakae]